MLAGQVAGLMIDLNMARGDRIRARRDFVEYGDAMPELNEGDFVHAFDEEGDAYIATVESLDGLHVGLRLDLSSRTPTERAWEFSNPYSVFRETATQQTEALTPAMTPAP